MLHRTTQRGGMTSHRHDSRVDNAPPVPGNPPEEYVAQVIRNRLVTPARTRAHPELNQALSPAGSQFFLRPVDPATGLGLTFPGVATGEAAIAITYQNVDSVPIRLLRLYGNAGVGIAFDPNTGEFLWSMTIGANRLHTGQMHSRATLGNVTPLSLSEGFVLFPGETLQIDAVNLQPPGPSFEANFIFDCVRLLNYANVPVEPTAEAQGLLAQDLKAAMAIAPDLTAMQDLAAADLERRFWTFVNGTGGVGGVVIAPGTTNLGAVDLVANPGPITTGFQNEQSGDVAIWGVTWFFSPFAQGVGGFQISDAELSNSRFISAAGGPIRSDVLRAGRFELGGFNGDFEVLPLIFRSPIRLAPSDNLRVTYERLAGGAGVNVWAVYHGVLYGNPQR